MKVLFIDKVRSLFVLNKKKFWWKFFDDYELMLARMRLGELAQELEAAKMQNDTKKQVMIEYVISQRIAKVQIIASLWSGWIGLLGAVLATFIGYYLGQSSEAAGLNSRVECVTGKIDQN